MASLKQECLKLLVEQGFGIPWLNRHGLIEAGVTSVELSDCGGVFHGLTAMASLKQSHNRDKVRLCVWYSMA